VKGGQLARIVYPARLFTLILSDVVGDPPDVIASGPTVADPTTFSDALKVLTDYSLTNDITAGVINYLKDGAAGKIAETPKPDDPLFQLTFNILAGNNLISLNSSKKLSASLGFKTYIIDAGLTGDVENACDSVISTALSFRNNNDIQKPVCLLYGGETTIRVTGSGTGGRNQHLALLAALRLKEIPGITVLAAGTDGNDGPTGAAGAVADNGTYKQAKLLDMEPESYVYDFNSYEFFKNVGGHVVTGPTFTNVMDIIVVIIE
jgi:hydroxypyruvate reductase/glycerate 2-kinase